jgi:hypothetical protein
MTTRLTGVPCSADGCDRNATAHGRCTSHNRRWLSGDISKPIVKLDKLAEFHRLRSLETDDCVVWPHARTSKGYGSVRYLGRQRLTHRLALSLATGGDRPGVQAAHGPCHNPACMNVRHLSWKTGAQNLADRDRDGTHQRGERGPRARLTEAQVRLILVSTDTTRDLAERYGVSRSAIEAIRSGRNWRHLDRNHEGVAS